MVERGIKGYEVAIEATFLCSTVREASWPEPVRGALEISMLHSVGNFLAFIVSRHAKRKREGTPRGNHLHIRDTLVTVYCTYNAMRILFKGRICGPLMGAAVPFDFRGNKRAV